MVDKTVKRCVLLNLVSSMVLSIFGVPAQLTAAESEMVDFNRDIQPLLSDRCFHCHGPDRKSKEAEETDLRLDLRESVVDEYGAIEPGDADASDLMERIGSQDPDTRMPPPTSHKPPLNEQQIELFRRWIEQGAAYQPHWSFIRPVRPDVPNVKQKDWVRNPIDAFVLARLESAGLQPSPEADKVTLIRRVTLDLTGLPPTPQEVDDFLRDDSPQAYLAVVDRLLKSDRYGERMAQVWLDAARYADTMGYQADYERFQWRWRTWVIDAYNRNLPFDQFTIEQLAGDLLPDPSVEQLIATGFNRNHRINDEGGVIPEEYLVEYIVDRVETTSAVWMGLTMGCARCHDHKFDPVSQVDFYRFFALFNNVPENGKDGRAGYATPYMRVAVRGKQPEYEALQQMVVQREQQLNEAVARLEPERRRWIEEAISQLESAANPWIVIPPTDVQAVGAVDFEPLEDGSYLATGDNLDRPVYTIELAPPVGSVTGIRLEALKHKSLTGGSLSPGNGNFVLSEFEVELQRRDDDKSQRITVASAVADYEQENWPIKDALDGKPLSGWAVDGHRKAEDRTAVFTFAEPIEIEPGDRLTVRMRHESKHARHSIGRFRLALTNMKRPDFSDTNGLPEDVLAALRTAESKRTKEQHERLARYHASINPAAELLDDSLEQARTDLDHFKKDHTTYVMVMREMDRPRDSHVLNRGLYNQPGEKVTAGVPDRVLGPLPQGAPVNRLGLARWLVSGNHPLTARVAVNQYWAMLFGTGLVKTVEDFGLQGEFPSHPGLLDWLATEYPRVGWDTKAMLKLMVTSATYRQSSDFPDSLRERDPENRLLARMPRLRLPAETIRDQALFAAGLLVERIGGPSVKPYQPAGLWSELSFQSKRSTDFYVQDTGDKLYRRSLYTFWKRSVPPPAMATFDAPSREMCLLSRPRTNTPMQALSLMNDVTYVEACRALAGRAMLETGDDAKARIRFAFRSLLAREPDKTELELLADGFEKRLAFFRRSPAAADKLISAGESRPDGTLDPIDLAGLTTVVMNILNLDEAINRE